MKDQELVNALRRLKVETGSLACLGCRHEHNCGVAGCAIIREAADRIDNQNAHIVALIARVPQWIPVTKRLPPYDEQVLVIASGKPKENIELIEACELATYYSDGWCIEAWPEWTEATVSRWMPLPIPMEPIYG